MPVLPRASHATHDVRNFLPALSHLARRIFSPADNPTIPQTLRSHPLQARQNTIAIPTVYQGLDSGPPAGEVVGIVLGSVAGVLLLIWLFSTLSGGNWGNESVVEEEVVVRRSRSPRSRRSRRSEMTSRSPGRPERVIRQERIIRETSRAPPRPGYVVAEERTERRVEGDDIVEVIEEGSSIAPRRKSKRSSGYRR